MTLVQKIKVYAGLSVKEAEIKAVLPSADYAEPIRRGNTFRDIRDGYHVIVIIDGRFQQSMAVSPSELMDTMRCGIKIYGSSSMGALRAVELEPYGMIGFGKIFEYIKQTPYFRDDYLGQIFTEGDHETLSEPYVNFMFSLAKMKQEGQLESADHDLLDEIYREIHFGERDLYTLIDRIKAEHAERAEDLVPIAKRAFSYHNQKREDGIGLLQQVKSDLDYIAKTNEELERQMSQIPKYDGLYPTQEEYEQQLLDFKKEQKEVRASYFADFLKQSAKIYADKKEGEDNSTDADKA